MAVIYVPDRCAVSTGWFDALANEHGWFDRYLSEVADAPVETPYGLHDIHLGGRVIDISARLGGWLEH